MRKNLCRAVAVVLAALMLMGAIGSVLHLGAESPMGRTEIGTSTKYTGKQRIWVCPSYNDVFPSHWFYDGLQKWRKEGIVVGDAGGNARLDDKITAAEVYTLFVRYIYSGVFAGEEVNGAILGDYTYHGHAAWEDAYNEVNTKLAATIKATRKDGIVQLPDGEATIMERKQAFILYAMAALNRVKDPYYYLNQFSDEHLGYYARSNAPIYTFDNHLNPLDYFLPEDHYSMSPLEIQCANLLMYLGVLNGKPTAKGENNSLKANDILTRAEGIKLLCCVDQIIKTPHASTPGPEPEPDDDWGGEGGENPDPPDVPVCPKLTLKVTGDPVEALVFGNNISITDGKSNLTTDGQVIGVQAGEPVTITATPCSEKVTLGDKEYSVILKRATLTYGETANQIYVNAGGTEGAFNGNFSMPNEDAILEIAFGLKEAIQPVDTAIPRPYDPRNTAVNNHCPSFLEDGFIYGENRGEYTIIEIPTLAIQNTLYDTDNYDELTKTAQIHDPRKAADKEISCFVFALYNAENETYEELSEERDASLAPYDYADLTNAPYNYLTGLWGEAERDYIGAKFVLQPKSAQDGSLTSNGAKLRDILDNRGSLGGDGRTQLYVKAVDVAGRESEYTPVWIRPWHALGVKVLSYGPTHELTASLYRLKDGAVDPANIESYEETPWLETSIMTEDEKSGKWMQLLRLRSSELLGDFSNDYDPSEDGRTLLDNIQKSETLKCALKLKKTSCIPYTRVNLDLNPVNYSVDAPLSGFYEKKDGTPDAQTRTFMVEEPIQLITGDIDFNGKTKIQDYDDIYDFVYRSRPWTDVKSPEEEHWDISIYNPRSAAYRCDLDGDRNVSVIDLSILRENFNYNRDATHYLWYGNGEEVLPFGLARRDAAIYEGLF